MTVFLAITLLITSFMTRGKSRVASLTINESNALLAASDNPRTTALITLCLNAGLYPRELLTLKLDSINWTERTLQVPGKRPRLIKLDDQTYEALAAWSQARPPVRSEALIISRQGARGLSAAGIKKSLRDHGRRCRFRCLIGPKLLHDTFALRLLSQNDLAISTAASLLGVNSVVSLDRYVKANQTPLAKIPERLDHRSKFHCLQSRWFPVVPKNAPRAVAEKPTMPAVDETLFGREGIVSEIKPLLVNKQPVLLIGPLGVGKTHLLKYLAKLLGPNTIYLSSPAPLKTMLSQICGKVDPEWKDTRKYGTTARELIDFIVRHRTSDVGHRTILIIDNLDKLKSSDADLIISLLDHFTILASTEVFIPKLEQLWWKFKQFKLHPLSERSARQLIKYLTRDLPISDYEMFETRVLNISNRFPLAMVDMVRQVSHQPVITSKIAREMYHEAGTRYRDWTPMLIVLAGAAMVFRYIAVGTHSLEGYIMAGSLIAIIMTVVRFMRMVK